MRSKMRCSISISDLTRSDLVRARIVLGSLLAALIMPKATLLSKEGMVASTTQRMRVSGLLRYLETRSVVDRRYSSGKTWMPGRSMSSKVGTSTCAWAWICRSLTESYDSQMTIWKLLAMTCTAKVTMMCLCSDAAWRIA